MLRQASFSTIVIGKHGLVREGLLHILLTANLRTCASPIEEVRSRKLRKCPYLLLLVLTDDDCNVTLEQIASLRDWAPASRIAIVADRYRAGEATLACRAGINGYFVSVTSCATFIKSIELIMMGETIFPPDFLSHVLDAGICESPLVTIPCPDNQAIIVPSEIVTSPHLSPRERSILQCLIEGISNKMIARQMDIAEATVKVHVKAILRKIRVQNRTQAAIWGINNGPLTRLNGSSLPEAVVMPS